MNLTKCKFDDVRLGAMFFDPKTGQKFQKIRSNSEDAPNARSHNDMKLFDLDDEVKAHKSKILNK